MRRRSFIASLAALALSPLRARAASVSRKHHRPAHRTHIVVVGAGAFGGWTALHLLRAGARVTLVESIAAGNSLSSSGGDTRVIRHAYEDRIYVDMAVRALALWDEFSSARGESLLHRTGVLFMTRSAGTLTTARTHLGAAGVAFEDLGVDQLQRRFPAINPEALSGGLLEPGAGYLSARQATVAVRDAVAEEGGIVRRARAAPGTIAAGEMQALGLDDGEALQADAYVFACGPWLGQMFPEVVGQRLKVTRQEVFLFRASDPEQAAVHAALPVWADFGERIWYGIPGGDGGFKVADDSRGPEVDPTTQSRTPSEAGAAAARGFIEYRFPGMRGASLAGGRVCQYAQTPDGHFIAGRHPQADNAWLLGGGSGHGFKHGPALGEMMADAVLGRRSLPPEFAPARFDPGA